MFPEWKDSIETLTPSPVVRQQGHSNDSPRQNKLVTSQQHHRQSYHGGSFNTAWEDNNSNGPGSGTSNVGVSSSTGIPSKASWEAQQPQYNASKYGLGPPDKSTSASSFPDPKASFVPQGYTRPVTKYVDANGVERRFIGRSASPGNINRHSYTENYFPSSFSLQSSGGGKAEFSSALNIPEAADFNSKGPLVSKSHHKSDTWSSGFGLLENQPERPPSRTFSRTAGRFGSSHTLTLHGSEGRGGGSLGGVGGVGANVGGFRKDWKDIGGGTPVQTKHQQDDLRHWQQLHQEELLHQHLETQVRFKSSPHSVANL